MAIYYRLCLCGENFTTTRPGVRWHSNKCRTDNRRALASKNKQAMEGSHTHEQWVKRLREFGYRCYWCTKQLDEWSATKEHLTPVSRGGRNDIANIVPACRPCNEKKGAKTAEEYLAYRERARL